MIPFIDYAERRKNQRALYIIFECDGTAQARNNLGNKANSGKGIVATVINDLIFVNRRIESTD